MKHFSSVRNKTQMNQFKPTVIHMKQNTDELRQNQFGLNGLVEVLVTVSRIKYWHSNLNDHYDSIHELTIPITNPQYLH